jgi:Fe-S-cluster containining protein
MTGIFSETQGQLIVNTHTKLEKTYPAIQILLDKTLAECEEKTGKKRDCRAGCSSCCKTQLIKTRPNEVAAIVSFLEKPNNVKIKLDMNAKLANAKPTATKIQPGPNTPCIFLNEFDDCSIYDVRPMVCRFYVSSDRNECAKWEQHGAQATTPGFASWAPSLTLQAKEISHQYCGDQPPMEINSIMKEFFLKHSEAERLAWLRTV